MEPRRGASQIQRENFPRIRQHRRGGKKGDEKPVISSFGGVKRFVEEKKVRGETASVIAGHEDLRSRTNGEDVAQIGTRDTGGKAQHEKT